MPPPPGTASISTAFTRPVDSLAGQVVEARRAGLPGQPEMLARKTGEVFREGHGGGRFEPGHAAATTWAGEFRCPARLSWANRPGKMGA